MKYQVIGKNIVITDGIKNAIKKKLSKLDKYFENPEDVDCRAVARSYKVGAKIEVTIRLNDMIFRAEVTNNDLYNGIDDAVEKLEGQLRKLKTKMKNRYNREGIGKSIIYEAIEDEIENSETEIVKTKVYNLKPITVDDAIIEMEAIGHDFYIYLDTDDERISVVYKRKDGGYGLIQAENKVIL